MKKYDILSLPGGHRVGEGRGPGLDADVEVKNSAGQDGGHPDDAALETEVEHVLDVAFGFHAIIIFKRASHGLADLQQLHLDVG